MFLQARELLGLGPVYVKLVGSFNELAILNMHPEELALSRGRAGPVERLGGECVFGRRGQ
jgi:hypothetical protein